MGLHKRPRKFASVYIIIKIALILSIVDPIYWRNLIPRMVHGKTMQGQDYRGICCAALTVISSLSLSKQRLYM
ncbi:unnamed protein product [Arabidopsis halleri]